MEMYNNVDELRKQIDLWKEKGLEKEFIVEQLVKERAILLNKIYMYKIISDEIENILLGIVFGN